MAGATGAVGSRLLPLLVSAGHSVVGLTRTPAETGTIRRVEAEPAIADALNRAAIVEAVASVKPDVIVHEMTSLSAANDLRRVDRSFAVTNRLRTEGLQNLLAAARQAGTRRIVAQSFCGWPYAHNGGPVKIGGRSARSRSAWGLRRTLEAIRYLENTVTASSEIDGVVLRYGAFYGPGTGLFDRPMIDLLQRRRVPLIGDANGWWSFLHIDDAAAATAIAIERGAPGIYNILDDEPAPVVAARLCRGSGAPPMTRGLPTGATRLSATLHPSSGPSLSVSLGQRLEWIAGRQHYDTSNGSGADRRSSGFVTAVRLNQSLYLSLPVQQWTSRNLPSPKFLLEKDDLIFAAKI